MTHAELQCSAVERIEAWLMEERRQRILHTSDGQLDSVAEPGLGHCRYEWDQRGDLVGIVEADGRSTAYEYDDARRLLRASNSGGAVTLYRYDGNDRLVEIDSPEQPRCFEYDESGRPRVTYRGIAGAVAYRYDQQGRVMEYRTAVISCEQEYDNAGRIAVLRQTINGLPLEIRQQYDSSGRLVQMLIPGASLEYDWDERGRPGRVRMNGAEVVRFDYVDAQKVSRMVLANGVVESSRADGVDGRPLARHWARHDEILGSLLYSYTAAGKIISNGILDYEYDALGRLQSARQRNTNHEWRYEYDAMGQRMAPAGLSDSREYTFDDAGQLAEVRRNGEIVARFSYDGKGRLAMMRTAHAVERYLYGAADELMAVTDEDGSPLRQYLRTPFGCVAEVANGSIRFFHQDERGNSLFVTDAAAQVIARHECDPYGLPVCASDVPQWFAGRMWNPVTELYYFGSRWYDPKSGRFLTPDTYTAAPDDARLIHPLVSGASQVWLREQFLSDWLRHPRARNRYAFCGNDPVNCVDPNGHWSFGRVLLMILGAIWTLPNTIFGLLIEITCLIGEVVRWLVWLVSAGNVSWATPGFDAAASGRLNAFALVFKGGWLGSFSSLLGITFGNVFFVYKDWESDPVLASGGTVSPPAYGGAETFPIRDALYEHELRHTVQYGWFGPFFHLGLPLFGIYEWDVILHGYRNSWLESNARDYGGI